MPTRNYDNLSPAYRARLERSGIDRASYEEGVSLSAARGHAKTPERPERAAKNPEKYREYLRSRNQVEQQLIRLKAQEFGSSPKFNAHNSRKAVMKGPDNKPRSIKRLQAAADFLAMLDSTGEQWSDIEDVEDDILEILYYH